MLYLRVWEGDETDWITVTPNNPDECDSELFDEGQCTGFKVKKENTDTFLREFLITMTHQRIAINVV